VLDQPTTTYGTRTLPQASEGLLEFRAVSVADALHDVTFTLPAGTCAAVVGRSGSGKSALAELAARLRDPDFGAVLLDGVELVELDRTELRDAVGCAFERPHLVGATVGDAVGLGRDPEVVRQAARAAQVHHFVVRLPYGYDTPLAETPMSGGERQRLGLTRAWPASRVLVLDDATSGLDTVTEMKVSRALFGADERRTRLIVTHRAATAASADLVVWLDGGRLRGLAPHDALWAEPDYRAALT
jgi:ATP-binding cassette subfamily B protein